MTIEPGGRGDEDLPSWPTTSGRPPPPPFAPRPDFNASRVTGRRIAAGLLDLVPLTFLAFAMGDRTASNGQFNVNLGGLKVLWWLLVAIAYYAVAELSTRTTPGKAIMGLCVRRDDARPATTTQILTRNGLRVVDILPAGYLVGLVAVAASSHGRRIGDMAAHTLVLRRSDVGEPGPRKRTIVPLVAVVAIILGAGVALLATAEDPTTKVGAFAVDEEVIPYAERVITEALADPSFVPLRDFVDAGVVTDAELRTFLTGFGDAYGGATDDYRIIDRERLTPTLPDGTTVDAVALRFAMRFEKRSGQLDLVIADVRGELRLIGFFARG